MVKKMKITSIQLYEITRNRLELRKLHPRESFDSVVQRLIKEDNSPTIEEMFERSKKLKHRKYSTEEIVRMTDEFDD